MSFVESNIVKSIDHDQMLPAFRKLYQQDVHFVALELLGMAQRNFIARYQQWALEPLLYTLERRNNLFRTGFSVAMGNLVQQPEVGRVAAAAGEIAWTVALVLDDLLDHSSEREGHPCAHVVYGQLRAWASIVWGLSTVIYKGATRATIPFAARMRMTRLGLRLLFSCIQSQIPLGGKARLLKWPTFEKAARDVNNSTHWSLLAPLVAFGEKEVIKLAWTYADATSVNGKMRNDILDYCGGSSESVTLYKDFDTHLITFPIVVLWGQNLSPEDRQRVERHFILKERADDFNIKHLLEIFLRYGTLDKCLEMMKHNADIANQATARLGSIARGSEPVTQLMNRWTSYLFDLAEHRVHVLKSLS